MKRGCTEDERGTERKIGSGLEKRTHSSCEELEVKEKFALIVGLDIFVGTALEENYDVKGSTYYIYFLINHTSPSNQFLSTENQTVQTKT
jgi:hypothetical protein